MYVCVCDYSQEMPGFVKFLTAKDIPGENNFMSERDVDFPEEVHKIIILVVSSQQNINQQPPSIIDS